MEISIIEGRYDMQETLLILEDIIKVKLRLLEKQIHSSLEIEDIQIREKSISELQKIHRETKELLMRSPKAKTIACKISFEQYGE